MKTDLLKKILPILIPEIKPTVGFEQNNPYHVYDVFEHTIKAMEAYEGDDQIVLMAILFHDIGKPNCYSEDDHKIGHFYGHAQISYDIAKDILIHMFPQEKELMEKILELVKYHDTEIIPNTKIIDSWIQKIGYEQLERLLEVKRADIYAQSDFLKKERIKKLDKIKNIMADIEH